MITQTSRYALSVLCCVVRHAPRRATARQIALETRTPANYVAKILTALRHGGIVAGAKGWGGGYVLRPAAAEMTLGQVIALFEDRPGPVTCPFVHPECSCYLAEHGEERLPVPAGSGAPGGLVIRRGPTPHPRPLPVSGVACPYGALACAVADPCPLHLPWAAIRQGYWALAAICIADLPGASTASSR